MIKKPIKPVYRRQITSATIDRLLSMISDGYWLPGEQLPPQRELSKSLGVGMSTLREALQSLQLMGILEMRHGEGTFVTNQPYDTYEKLLDLSLSLGDLDFEMLFEARGIVESGFAYYAATRATEEQIVQLFEILQKKKQCIDEGETEDCHDLDLSFHQLIAEMANNKFLQQIDSTLFKALDKLLRVLPQTEKGWRLHYAVAEAIRDRDPFRASESMQTLIEASAAQYIPLIKMDTVGKKT